MIRVLTTTAILAAPAMAQHSPYAGGEGRAIASLSAADVAALEAGEGWGLARSAELNGWPGPAHILELAAELELTGEQMDAVQAIWDAMNADARSIGAELIEAEAALDAAFEDGTVTSDALPALVAAAEEARARLRARHLAAHLQATPILSRHQRVLYDRLRGYGDGLRHHDGHGGH